MVFAKPFAFGIRKFMFSLRFEDGSEGRFFDTFHASESRPRSRHKTGQIGCDLGVGEHVGFVPGFCILINGHLCETKGGKNAKYPAICVPDRKQAREESKNGRIGSPCKQFQNVSGTWVQLPLKMCTWSHCPQRAPSTWSKHSSLSWPAQCSHGPQHP